MSKLKEYLVSEALQSVIGNSSDELRLEVFCLSKQGAFKVVRSGNSVTCEQHVHEPDSAAGRSWPFASVSKPVVSQMAYRAAKEGLIDLDQSAVDALRLNPERLISSKHSQICLRHLFSHTSGLPTEASPSLWTTLCFPTEDELVQAFCNAEVAGSPGDQVRYSNFGFSLGAHILQSVMRKSVQEMWSEFAARDSRFKGMSFSGNLQYESIVHGRLAEQSLRLESYSAAGSLMATADQLAYLVGESIANPGFYGGCCPDDVLSEDKKCAVHDVQVGDRVGMLWHYKEFEGVDTSIVYHTGTLPGASSFVMGSRESGLCVAFASNRNIDSKPLLNNLCRDLAMVEKIEKSLNKSLVKQATYEMPHFDSRLVFWGTKGQHKLATLHHYNQNITLFKVEPQEEELSLRTVDGARLAVRFRPDCESVDFCDQKYLRLDHSADRKS